MDGSLGGRWRDLPERFGAYQSVKRRYYRWIAMGVLDGIIGNFNLLSGIIFKSFAGLGLKASGASIGQDQLLQPGRLAQVGVQAAQPMLDEIGKLAGFPSVFPILAVQLFVSVLEFKLTTLAGFVLVPFALWGQTSFLAEKGLGNVVASGIKVLVLTVIVGIGTGLFSQFQSAAGAEPNISEALAIVLGSVALLGLGIFGSGIANGLVSGAPQLGAGAAATAPCRAARLRAQSAAPQRPLKTV